MTDRNDDVAAQEAEVAADEQALPETAEPEQTEPQEPAKTEYLEFVGDAQYGTQFYSKEVGAVGHSVTAAHLKQYHDIDLGKKVVEWKRGANGRFLVPVSDMTPEAAELLANDPMFKRVEL
jgi:hypothetical protein